MLRPTVFVLENFRCKFANFVAPFTNGTAKRLLRCVAQPVLGHRELCCNRNSIGDAMVPHIDTKVLQICGSEVGGSLWRHLSRREQEAQLMLTTGSTRLAVSRGQQTWYHSTCNI